MDIRCNDVLLMFETKFFDHWVKRHLLYRLLLLLHWSINHFQCLFARAGSLELIYKNFEFWLWATPLKSLLLKEEKKTLWPFFMDGVQLPQGYSYFEEAVYFLPFSFLEIPGTHFIDLGRMKGWVHLGATQWFWTRDPWIGNPAP